MEALKYFPKEKRLDLVRTPRPKVTEPHGVLVKVFFAALSKTDLKIVNGSVDFSPDVDSIVLGREMSGTVRDVGEAVTTIKKGDRVTIIPTVGCGTCKMCQSAKMHFCADSNKIVNSINKDGGVAECILVKDCQVYKLPNNLPLELAILTNSMSLVTHCWEELSPISIGEKILIIGLGLNGGLWTCLLHLHGYQKVTIVEKNKCRIENIEKMTTGFECISPEELKRRQVADPSYLFNVILDCSGVPEMIEQALTLLNICGKLLLSVEYPSNSCVSIPVCDIPGKEIKIIGARGDPLYFNKGLEYLAALSERYLTYENLGIKRYSIRDYKDLIEHNRSGVIVKGVFEMSIRCSCSKKTEENKE